MKRKIVISFILSVIIFSLTSKSAYAIWPFDQIKNWLRKKVVKEWRGERKDGWEMPFSRWSGSVRPPMGRRSGWQFWQRKPKRIWAGEVKLIEDNQFILVNNKGEEKVVLVDEKTIYHIPTEKWQGSFTDLKVGGQVRVFGPPTDGQIQANRVIILPERPTLIPRTKPTRSVTPTQREL